jgi:hypothetical protein
MEWTDTTSRRRDEPRDAEARTWEMRVGWLRIIVTRDIYHADDEWVLKCHPIDVEESLGRVGIDAAKAEALDRVYSRMAAVTQALWPLLGRGEFAKAKD